NVRLGLQFPAESNKFIGPETVRLHVVPGQVHFYRARIHRADPVHPVVTGDEVTAWPPEIGEGKSTQSFQYIGSDLFTIRKFAVFVVNAPIDTAAEVFDKPPIDIGVYFGDHPVYINLYPIHYVILLTWRKDDFGDT